MTRTKSPFVLDAVEEFLRTKEAREPKTYASYSSILLGSERGTKPSLGIPLASYFRNRRFATLTHDEVATWFAQRVRGGAQVTKHRISKSSRAFLRFARERRYTEHDLASAIAAYSAGGPRVDWLGWPEIHQLVGAIPEPRYRFAVSWLFWSGCRVGEACTARQQDVQLRHEVGFYEWSIPNSKTHIPRKVWLPDHLGNLLKTTRAQNSPRPDWPVLWDCAGIGFARIEDPSCPISPRTINGALERARDAINLAVNVTAHVAKHSYCTNWIHAYGNGELAMEKLSRQVGTSVAILRETYVHINVSEDDWADLRAFGDLSA